MEIFLLIIVVHWVADFIFQAEKWSLGKSKSLPPLLKHTITYSTIWVLPALIMTNDLVGCIEFFLITFIFHTITDYFTSRIVRKRFDKKHYGSPIPNFGAFTVIGFDQVLHYVQLILTWEYIFGI